MRYERVKITRDPHTVYNRSVFPWEVAILEFTFGDGNVIVQEGEYEITNMPYPSAGEEFGRLATAYGSDPQSGVPYVSSVYGQASAGVNHLKRVMADAKLAEEAARPKPSKRKGIPARKRVDVTSDPLMA